MFGAFYLGDLYFGKSIWGPDAPVRPNPDIDGNLVQAYTPTGRLIPATYQSGVFVRTYDEQSTFPAVNEENTGSFTRTIAPHGKIERLK